MFFPDSLKIWCYPVLSMPSSNLTVRLKDFDCVFKFGILLLNWKMKERKKLLINRILSRSDNKWSGKNDKNRFRIVLNVSTKKIGYFSKNRTKNYVLLRLCSQSVLNSLLTQCHTEFVAYRAQKIHILLYSRKSQ